MKIRQRKADLLFWLQRSRVRKDGRVAISLRITTDPGVDCELATGIFIHPGNWDIESKRVLKAESKARQLNDKLDSLLVDIKRIHDALCLQSEEITPQKIKAIYKGKDITPKEVKGKQTLTLIDAFDGFILKFEKLVNKKERSDGTLRQWRSTRKKVIEFLQFECSTTDISFPMITPLFADKMYDYLTIGVEKSLSDASAKKHIKKVKQVIKTGVKLQAIASNPIADFVCGGDQKDVPPLEIEEVMRIYHKDFGNDRLNEVRDAFIFQCFTGFAYQDIYGLSRENIIYVGFHREPWLAKNRGKTGVNEIVPVLPIIDQLIERYKDHLVCHVRGALMPINSNARYNGYLKEIAAICNIQRQLNTHLARHTFADIMLNLGMSLEEVSKMLGHKSIRTTQRYCRVRKERIQKSFNENIRPVLTMNKLQEIAGITEKAPNQPEIPKINAGYSQPSCSSTEQHYSFQYVD
ncbi:MAG: site-specific integrase [Chryseobacterium sp.]|nr:MAG: site-specific integrase [Chryseobacterium sp.]